jgi:hypothetical protein
LLPVAGKDVPTAQQSEIDVQLTLYKVSSSNGPVFGELIDAGEGYGSRFAAEMDAAPGCIGSKIFPKKFPA